MVECKCSDEVVCVRSGVVDCTCSGVVECVHSGVVEWLCSGVVEWLCSGVVEWLFSGVDERLYFILIGSYTHEMHESGVRLAEITEKVLNDLERQLSEGHLSPRIRGGGVVDNHHAVRIERHSVLSD